VMTALMTDDRGWSRSSRMDNTVDRLDEAIKLYVTKLTRGSLDERGGRRAAEIISFAINLEHIGDIIDRNLCEVAAKKIKRRLQFSNEGVAELMGRRGILPPGVIEPCIPIPNLAAESPFGPGGVQLICGPLMVIPSRRLPASCRARCPESAPMSRILGCTPCRPRAKLSTTVASKRPASSATSRKRLSSGRRDPCLKVSAKTR
jgi:hypothetical protein